MCAHSSLQYTLPQSTPPILTTVKVYSRTAGGQAPDRVQAV